MNRVALLAVAALAVVGCQRDTTSPAARNLRAPASAPSLQAAQLAPGRYIVVLKAAVFASPQAAAALVSAANGKLVNTYSSGIINGFAADLDAAGAARMAADPLVQYIEPDQVFTINAGGTQTNPPAWGIDRIDQRNLPLDAKYVYPNTANNVFVYIVDTGINYSHTEYVGRATTGQDEITPGGSATDCNGHGSHVSGTVGGTNYGVAKQVNLVGVRVLDCSGSGTTTTVVNGLNYVLQQKQANPTRPMVVNMSLGGSASPTLDNAVLSLTNAGVIVVVAAGNSAGNACLESPARAPSAITVGATTIADGFASFSNFGSCVDILAPGVSIKSAWIGSTTATNTISGTSMATPHVVGAAALYLSVNPAATVSQVTTALTTNATANAISNVPASTVNKLLYMGFISGGGGPNNPPVAKFTFLCGAAAGLANPLQCAFDASTSTDDFGIVNYNWQWGDGRSESHATATAKNGWANPGTYQVTLTVTDGGGLTNAITKAVTVPAGAPNQSPTAQITGPANNTSVVQGTTLNFAGNGSDPEDGALTGASLVWTSNRDGQIGTGTSFPKSNLSVGTHTITLTATDSQGATGTASITVTITPPPNQPPVANFTFVCGVANGLNAHQCAFNASSSTDDVGIVSYRWDWGDGRVETKTVNTAKNSWLSAPATFNVTLTVTDGGGLTNSITKAVAVP